MHFLIYQIVQLTMKVGEVQYFVYIRYIKLFNLNFNVMKGFICFNRSEKGDELTIRVSAIIAFYSSSDEKYTQLIISGIEKPILVLGSYLNIKKWIEDASE